MSRYTNGPWVAVPGNGISIESESGFVVAVVHRGVKTHDEFTANAQLLATAPELLQSVEWLLPLAEAYLKAAPTHPDNAKLESARAAVRKATEAQ